MARLCLPNSALHVGIDFDHDPRVQVALHNPDAPAVLLYPGDDATDILGEPPKGPITLVVIDGTWRQARSVMRLNPQLATLPRYAFTAPKPSEYRIRKEPSIEVVSTIESLMYALGAIEGDPQRFTALLAPFRAMVDTQLQFHAGKRKRSKKRVAKIIPTSPALELVRARKDDIVCVVGEANAWPYGLGRHRDRDELAHWVAYRLGDGAQFSMLAQPQYGWSPTAERTMQLTAAQLAGAQPPAELYAAFAAFLRPRDLVCTWSWYATRLFGYRGHTIDVPVFDARKLLEEVLRTRVPRLESYAAQAGLAPPTHNGRAGQRLAVLVAAMQHCLASESIREATDENATFTAASSTHGNYSIDQSIS